MKRIIRLLFDFFNFRKRNKEVDLKSVLSKIKDDKGYPLLPDYQACSIVNICNANNGLSEKILKIANNKKTQNLLKFIMANNFNVLTDEKVVNAIAENVPKNGKIAGSYVNIYNNTVTQIYLRSNDEINIVSVKTENGESTVCGIEKIKRTAVSDNKQSKESVLVRQDNSKIISSKEYYRFKDREFEFVPFAQKSSIYDKDGNLCQTEIIKPSSVDMTQNEIIISEKDGVPKTIGSVTKNGDETTVKREVVSFDNTCTQYTRKQSTKGFSYDYQITDSDKKKIFSQTKEYKSVDETHTQTKIKNDKQDIIYDVEYRANDIVIKKKDLKQKDSDVKEVVLNLDGIDDNSKKIYKNLSGDLLWKLQEYNVPIKEIDDEEYIDNAYYDTEKLQICISKTLRGNPYAIAHEIGHLINNNKTNIFYNNGAIEVYQKELRQYKANHSLLDEGSIDRFTSFSYASIEEAFAESVAILSGNTNKSDTLTLRNTVFQQHFPKTIAYISNLID